MNVTEGVNMMLNLDALAALCRQYGAEFAADEPMSAHTTFRVGGNCRAFITLKDAQAAAAVIGFLRDGKTPFRLIGRGSNLLVRDTGYPGVVLVLGGALAEVEEPGTPDSETVVCGAGASLKNLCLAAQSRGLTGLEFAYGIPGTVGGAVYMNAGAYDGEMSQVLESVTVLDENGEQQELPASALSLSYRHSIFMEQPQTILKAAVKLKKGDPAAIRARMQELLARRQEKQPLEYPSAGSTFKRPAGSYASLLIDQCGLKGYRVGGAQVSEKHAGFVINRGSATYADIMAVCRHVQETVKAQTGYHLELEPETL